VDRISETDLILNADGSVYHLNLLPGDIASTIITVGDPERVAAISKYFDRIEVRKSKREFVTHTGYFGDKRLTVISTGIGTGNIDIVLNELDALVNIDLDKRRVNDELQKLTIIRIGTSGAIQADIPVNSLLVSTAAVGFDSLMHYYPYTISVNGQKFMDNLLATLPKNFPLFPYLAEADKGLLATLGEDILKGITLTAPGFYAPQGRQLRAKNTLPDLITTLQHFNFSDQYLTNIEMETAGLYGMASALGHRAISFNVILANRVTQNFSTQPQHAIEHNIKLILEKVTTTQYPLSDT